jgi:hypothetical protein
VQSRSADYYRQAVDEIQEGLTRSQGINAAMLGNIQQAGNTEQDRLTSAQQLATDTTANDAAARGSGLQVGNRVAEELAAARAQSAARSATEQGTAAQNAGVFENLQNLIGQTGTLQGAERQTQLQNMQTNAAQRHRWQARRRAGSGRRHLLQEPHGPARQGLRESGGHAGPRRRPGQARGPDGEGAARREPQGQAGPAVQPQPARLVKLNAKVQAGYKLTAAEQKRIARMGIDIKRGVDPITGKKIPKGTTGTGTGGVKPLTPAEKRAERGDLNKTAGTISNAIGTAKLLKNGRRSSTVTPPRRCCSRGAIPSSRRPATRRPASRPPRSRSRASSQHDQLVASIALDIAYDGHVSYHNYRLAHKRYPGLLRILGVPVNRKQIKKPGLQGVAGIQG